jgi:hypothetical protein
MWHDCEGSGNVYRLLIGKTEEEKGLSGVNWIGIAQEGDKWRALVNAVMNLRFL